MLFRENTIRVVLPISLQHSFGILFRRWSLNLLLQFTMLFALSSLPSKFFNASLIFALGISFSLTVPNSVVSNTTSHPSNKVPKPWNISSSLLWKRNDIDKIPVQENWKTSERWARFESLFKPHRNPQVFTSNQALIAKQQRPAVQF